MLKGCVLRILGGGGGGLCLILLLTIKLFKIFKNEKCNKIEKVLFYYFI